MSPSKLGVFAHLALAASAVLIPPTVTTDDVGDDGIIEGLVINPFERSVALECPGCAFATAEKEKPNTLDWEQDVGNVFLLNFAVDPLQNSLDIDGYQLYPPTFSFSTEPFYVTQVDPNTESSLRLRVTGYEFRYNGAETVSEAGTELLPMTFQINSVEGIPVAPPALTINVLKDSNGRLMIASFQIAQPTGDTPIAQEKDCKEWPLLCKWKSIMADRFEKTKKVGKGCHKRPHGGNPMAEETTEGKPPHRFRPGRPHHRPHHMSHGGHRHHEHHRFHMFLRRAFFTILIPILIGIFAGTLTYLVGMALGCLTAMLIAKIRGQSYQRIALEEDVEEAAVESEKEQYAELPAYDAPPVYEDAAEKEVDEMK